MFSLPENLGVVAALKRCPTPRLLAGIRLRGLSIIGYSKENLKIQTGVPSPHSPPLPSPPLLPPAFPSLCPLPLLSYIPLPLEVGPLKSS